MRRAAFAAILLVVTGCANPQAGPTAPGRPSTGLGTAHPASGAVLSLSKGRQALRVADVTLEAPAGFQVNLFAENLGRARFMALDPRGRLMVCDMGGGRVLTLPDEDHDGRADRVVEFASGVNLAHSLAWRQGKAYVTGGTEVVEFTDTDGDGVADSRRAIIDDLPDGPGHITRTIVFDPAEKKMYVSVGSSSNVTPEQDRRRAAVLRFDPDGSHMEVFATGLRNSVGLAFDPTTGQLWGTDNGRDWLGDNLPPDELNIIREGGFYGWPWYYGDNIPDPEFKTRPAPGIPPALELQAHSAPLGLCFYTGEQFPQEYRGDVFVCFHGSWNRTVSTGYKLVRVRVREGRPASYEDFLTGFLTDTGVTGRPVDPIVGADGALYFSDDQRGRIYRVTWGGGS